MLVAPGWQRRLQHCHRGMLRKLVGKVTASLADPYEALCAMLPTEDRLNVDPQKSRGGRVAVRTAQRATIAHGRFLSLLGMAMCDVTQILGEIEAGDPLAADKLMTLIYDELRKLAAEKMAQENPGQTLQATALVHEAYIRLVDVDQPQHWDSRGHFFAAAAEAMRRILVEQAPKESR